MFEYRQKYFSEKNSSAFPMSDIQKENEKILSLLETLQEYERAQAALQSTIVDGFMELAQSRRQCSGIVCPELLISHEQETRKFFMPGEDIGPNPITPFIPGVSQFCMNNIQNEFESSLKYAINLVAIVGQINEKIASFNQTEEQK
ncbi:hypothetical protein TRFO_07841 [Tritrichomonas foetus]|uniref:Uncharacterized protein n=1 Tax=Tritrichomonas foetus TaxID=1144522 RepID=A0A1J4JP65_9EUKA|nr:hypothetical protein TRFO_07841 [Tritrichomonas foetus]|eukprot:OHT00530.1 hypothetical protein TRFO_07841 [Tritrichomonas foetus]